MKLQYIIHYDETISRWNMTHMEQEPFMSPKKAFQAEVNLEESYVQVVYPVREEFLRQNRIDQVERYDGGYEDLYFPFENNRVDLSTFMHTPHHIWIHAMAGVEVADAGLYPFEIHTCGGVKIWVNGQETDCFGPYTRNIAGCRRVLLPFQAGYNEIKVYADELAERDVFFYFEFRYKGESPITGLAETREEPEKIKAVEKFLSSCYFEQDLYTGGQVRMRYQPELLSEDAKLYFTSVTSGTGGQLSRAAYREVPAKKTQDYLVYRDAEEGPICVSNVYVCQDAGSYRISRKLFVAIIPRHLVTMKPEFTIEGRKRQALRFLYEHGEMGMQTVIAALELKKTLGDKGKQALDLCLKKIEAKEDCADFSLTPMTVLLNRYADCLTFEEKERIHQAVLHFRYWIDEPGDDVMWYFSENHAFLFHISQYLWGHRYPQDTFTESGRTGAEQETIGKKRVEEWFETFFRYGYAEWNSATYIPIDFIGFFTLYLCAPDQEIRDMAKRALDFSMRIVACHTYCGVMNATYGRVYENTIKARLQVETNFLQWVSYGHGYLTYFGNSVQLYAISDYEPENFEAEYQAADGEGLVQELDQGLRRVKIHSFRTKDYLTSAVRRFKPFCHGHQQHLMNVALGADKGALFYVNHPGERLFSGENRPSYWAGNGTMPWIERYDNVTIMLFDIDPKELVHRIHAYAPVYEYDQYVCAEHFFFASSGDGYLSAWFSNPVTLTSQGANTGKELISEGLKHAVIVKCGSKTEFGSFERFKEEMKKVCPVWDGGTSLAFTDPQYGSFQVTKAAQFCLNGQEIPYLAREGFALERKALIRVEHSLSRKNS